MRQIILASTSPQRKQLLTQLLSRGFSAKESKYEEDNSLKMPPLELVSNHALQKGRAVASTLKSGIVIAADTVVVHAGKVIGKPKDAEDARAILRSMSGKEIQVITGLAVIDVENRREIQDRETTTLKVKKLTREEIGAYVGTGEPLHKAGAFGIQGQGTFLVEKIDGDYTNVVGLPLYRLTVILQKLGVSIFEH